MPRPSKKPEKLRRAMLFGALLSSILPACARKPKLAALPSGSTVLAFGDSVTFGTGAAAGEDWPSLLAERTGWRVGNAGIPGDTAEAAKSRIQSALDEHQPALLIIEIGGNDFLRRRPSAAIKEDIRQLIRSGKAAGARVVLIAVPELSLMAVVAGRPADSPIYEQLAREEDVPVISNVFSDILARPELCADRIHPNAAGYREFARGVDDSLRRIGLKGSP